MIRSFDVYKCKLVREGQINYLGQVTMPEDIVSAAKELGFMDFAEEVFGMLALDTKGNIIGYHEISHGNLYSTVIHPREVFKRALVGNCSCIAFVHNHPSGDPTPSFEDIKTTEILLEAGALLGIKVVDHIIIGSKESYYSMKQHGDM